VTGTSPTTSVTWLGHSTTKIELDGVTLLTDPMLRRRVAHLRREQPVAPEAVSALDAVLVSHLHMDHLDVRSFTKLERSLRVIVPTGGGSILRRRGFNDVIEVEAGDELTIGGLTIDVTHADHDVKRLPGGKRSQSVGFLVRGTRSVYFAGDTDLFDGMAELAGSDVALLPISGWGPKLPAGHLNPKTAAQALQLLRPRVVIPIHWGTYSPLHIGPDKSAPELKFAGHAAELAPEVSVRLLPVGGTYSRD
jgi:L-ascorbate metabolism protein UlaG (beta-lactamase superfamily)